LVELELAKLGSGNYFKSYNKLKITINTFKLIMDICNKLNISEIQNENSKKSTTFSTSGQGVQEI